MARLLRPLGRDLRASLDEDVAGSGVIAPDPRGTRVTSDDLAELPLAVQRYLHFMGVVGRPRDWSFRAHASGRFRLRPGRGFMRSESWQYDAAAPITRLFHMRIDFARFVPMVGRDSYVGGHGEMRGRLLGCIPVATGSGDEFDIGELTTYLNDGVLIAPSMLLVPAVTWSAIDDDHFGVSLTDASRTVTATVQIDERGAPVDFRSRDRYAALPSGPTRAEWSTPVHKWTVVGGRAQPVAVSAVWYLPDGEFTYAEFMFERGAVEFNVAPTTYRRSDVSSQRGSSDPGRRAIST